MDSSIAPKGEGVLTIRGVDISYEILGKTAGGVPIVLTPGGGGGKAGLRWLAQRLRGSRQALVWDRPNCGHSGMTLGDDLRQPEPDMQARRGAAGDAASRPLCASAVNAPPAEPPPARRRISCTSCCITWAWRPPFCWARATARAFHSSWCAAPRARPFAAFARWRRQRVRLRARPCLPPAALLCARFVRC